MFGECHAHIFMDGINYKKAAELHKNEVQDAVIRRRFQDYADRRITFIRDGGDALGVSKRAKELAPEYGIDYRTPIFAIHREGYYGGIVGRGYTTMREYHELVMEAKKQGADFIKIMTTGILDFNDQGEITGIPLPKDEVQEMVHIAHEEGMAVMSHTNGVYGVQAAIEAGADSIEHGNYMDRETIERMAERRVVWIPTLVTVRNLLGCRRYKDDTLLPIIKQAEKSLTMAWEAGVQTALGSDAGAYQVMHGEGTRQEYSAFLQILGNRSGIDQWLLNGEKQIRERFKKTG